MWLYTLKLLASSYIFVILDWILYSLFINYASLLDIFIKFIRLYYARFYNILKAIWLFGFAEADLILFIKKITTNTLYKTILVQKRIKFLFFQIQIILAILPIENLINKKCFLFKKK